MSTAVLEPGVYWVAEDQAWNVVPKHLGPTWQEDPAWDGDNEGLRYILPEFTLGWQILKWIGENVLGDDVDIEGNRLPFIPTGEQSRFILWWYAIDENGRFSYRQGVLQRLKGWGKDPIVAVLAIVELLGPCRFGGWAVEDMPDIGVLYGDPVGIDNPRAWIQIAAVNKDQTVNTSALFPGMLSAEHMKEKFGLDIGKEIIYAYGGQRRIQCVTSSPRGLEGGRPTFVIMNETHHWRANNEGHAMFKVITRNVTKSKGGAARILAITNAYDPSEDSVAQKRRETYEEQLAGLAYNSRVLYDSIEAPPDARIRPKKLREDSPDPTEDEVKAYLAAVVSAVRGDATWLDLETILAEIMDTNNPAGESRRFYFNQIIASEDSWVDPAAVEAAIDKVVATARRIPGSDDLHAGWIVMPHEPVVAFFDGSKSDDASALVGCRIEDGYCFTIGVWQPPSQKERAKKWLAPRGAITSRVDEMFERFNVVGFWADPSHATEDSDGSNYWDDTIDDWMKRHGRKLDKKVWPVKGGLGTHAINFDMTSPTNQKAFVQMAMQTVEDFEALNQFEEFGPKFMIDGHPALVQHLRNARSNPSNKWGVSMMKENRESKHKIDLAVCLVGARLLRKVYLNTEEEEDQYADGAEVWGY
jgi:phage terminase large subunit-like protein